MKMKRYLKALALFAVAALTALTLISCAASYDGKDFLPAGGGNASSPPKDWYETMGDAYENENQKPTEALFENRKIIKNVNETVQTEDFDGFMTSLYEAINEAGGYVSSRNESSGGYYNSGASKSVSLVIKIPAEKLDGFTSRVGGLGSVVSYRESTEDVTEAYIDIDSRIAVLEAEESALLTILAKAETTADALSVREALVSVQSELASLRARKRSYDARIDFSTVNLYVTEVRRAEKANPTFLEEVGGNFSDSLYELGEDFRSIGVFLLGDSPYIILVLLLLGGVGTLAFFVGRKLWRRFIK